MFFKEVNILHTTAYKPIMIKPADMSTEETLTAPDKVHIFTQIMDVYILEVTLLNGEKYAVQYETPFAEEVPLPYIKTKLVKALLQQIEVEMEVQLFMSANKSVFDINPHAKWKKDSGHLSPSFHDLLDEITESKEKVTSTKLPDVVRDAIKLVPALAVMHKCPKKPCGFNQSLWSVIVHLNDAHKWKRQEIADWLDTLDVDLSVPIPGRENAENKA